ncbi:MAG: Re/Si-specific NAD(P)(+) transhydrogenase subunit alpha [Candidatus Thiodiazotropha sp.]
MNIGVPKEIHPNEKRVALTPSVAQKLQRLGFCVHMESGAGLSARFSDDDYRDAGVEIMNETEHLWSSSDIVLKVRAPEEHPGLGIHEGDLLAEGSVLVCFIWPAQNEDLIQKLAKRKVTVFAMDAIPRISRAQKMDALSSMANIAGYRAVVEAANAFGRFFTGQITAAGKMPPAKVLVIGAGVAGLSAIGAAGSMGAIVRAFDTRPEVKEQVESMGAEFLELSFKEQGGGEGGYAKVMSKAFIEAEMALFHEQAKQVDIIITTALIPGKPAPKLITADMVRSMREGSVVVDLASEQGGNCELTEPGEVVERHGVTLIGHMDLPSRLATQSSQLYSTNLFHLLSDLTPGNNGEVVINMEDEVIRGATVIKDGEITWPPPPPRLSAAPVKPKPPVATTPPGTERQPTHSKGLTTLLGIAIALIAVLGVGAVAPESFLSHFIVFVLACFVGWQVIWAVTPALHTPLMSVTNAISGIIVIGALLQAGSSSHMVMLLALFAVLIASINIVGGFFVTQRMLKMFSRES